jgi:thiol-disulfide isomerase/thioredoxin
MRKLILLSLTALLTHLTGFGQGYNIEFNISGLNSGECIIAHYYADQNRIVDTAEVNAKGQVIFKGKNPLLNGVYLLVLPDRNYVEFVVPIDDQEFRIDFDTSLSIANRRVFGSAENSIFLEFDQFANIKGREMRDLKKREEHVQDDIEKNEIAQLKKDVDKAVKDKRLEIISKYPTSFVATIFKAGLEVEIPASLENDTTGLRFEYYRDHYWDNINLKEDGLIRTPIFFNKLEYYLTKMHLQMADSLIPVVDKLAGQMEAYHSDELFKYTVWWTTKHYEDAKVMCMDKLLHHMAKDYYCAGRCFWADSAVVAKMCDHASKIAPTLCDVIAPDMTLWDTTLVREVTMSKIEYPVTILVFWDPECGHCKKELPKIKELYDTMNAKGVQVYAIYTQGDWEGWKKYVRENKLGWINVMDPYNKSTYRKDYNIISTPQVLVLDEDKRIRFKNAPADNLGDICDYLIKEYEEKHNPTEQ